MSQYHIYLSQCHNHLGPFQHRPLQWEILYYRADDSNAPIFSPLYLYLGNFYLVTSILDPSVLKQDRPLPNHQLYC